MKTEPMKTLVFLLDRVGEACCGREEWGGGGRKTETETERIGGKKGDRDRHRHRDGGGVGTGEAGRKDTPEIENQGNVGS